MFTCALTGFQKCLNGLLREHEKLMLTTHSRVMFTRFRRGRMFMRQNPKSVLFVRRAMHFS